MGQIKSIDRVLQQSLSPENYYKIDEIIRNINKRFVEVEGADENEIAIFDGAGDFVTSDILISELSLTTHRHDGDTLLCDDIISDGGDQFVLSHTSEIYLIANSHQLILDSSGDLTIPGAIDGLTDLYGHAHTGGADGAGVEGADILSAGEGGGSKFLREDGDGTSSWQAGELGAHTHEGVEILSTDEGGGFKFLREDGDDTCSWQDVGFLLPTGAVGCVQFNDAGHFGHADSFKWDNVNKRLFIGDDPVKIILTQEGSITAVSFNSTSLRNLKENIKPFKKDALAVINKTEINEFNFISDKKKELRIGFVADDTDPILSGKNKDKFDINNTIGVLLKAVQELNNRLGKLEGVI